MILPRQSGFNLVRLKRMTGKAERFAMSASARRTERTATFWLLQSTEFTSISSSGSQLVADGELGGGGGPPNDISSASRMKFGFTPVILWDQCQFIGSIKKMLHVMALLPPPDFSWQLFYGAPQTFLRHFLLMNFSRVNLLPRSHPPTD